MTNPLARYRSAQRAARALFASFTEEHCPTCATPCCRKPVRVRPVDIILVQELGYSLPGREQAPASAATALADAALAMRPEQEGAPCEFLGSRGCAFPDDLRPLGCAAFICQPMRRELPAGELAVIEAAVADLERAY